MYFLSFSKLLTLQSLTESKLRISTLNYVGNKSVK